MSMTFNFNDTIDARGLNGVPLDYIIGSDLIIDGHNYGHRILWERPFAGGEIVQYSEKFLLMTDINQVEIEYNYPESSPTPRKEKIKGLTWKFCISPQKWERVNGVYSLQKDISQISGDALTRTTNDVPMYSICGYTHKVNKVKVEEPSAVWQFIRFSSREGIFLYSPTYNLIVSKKSGYYPNDWIFTNKIIDGFDISPYLSSNVFSTSGYTNYETSYQRSSTLTEVWQYKQIHSHYGGGVNIFVPDESANRPDNIATWFTYNPSSVLLRLYMVKPQISAHLAPSTTISTSGFIRRCDDNVSSTTADGRYIMLVPYNANGWTVN